MDRKKKITPITNADYQAVIDNSVQGVGSRLVGSAAEQKKLYVRPIANMDGSPNVLEKVQRLAKEAEDSIEEVGEAVGKLGDDAQYYYDERLETEKKNVPDAINEVLGIANEKVTKTDKPNKLYGTDKYGRSTVYELNEVGDIVGVDLGFEIVRELPEVGATNVLYFIPIENTEDDNLFEEWVWLNKGTDEEPAFGWERIGSKKVTIDHSEYVKFTDIANYNKAGVVKVNQANSGMRVLDDGQLKLYPASPVAITFRPQSGVNYNETSPITLGNLNEAVIATFTDDKKMQMSEGQKAKACETIGAVKKDASVTTHLSPLVYTNDTANNHYLAVNYRDYVVYNIPMLYGSAAGKDAVNAHLLTATPANDYHAANKKYVDDAIANIEVSGGTNLFLHRVYCHLTDDLGTNGIFATLMFANADGSSYAAVEPDSEWGEVPSELIGAFEDPLASPNSVSLYIEDENVKHFLSEVSVYDGVLWIGFSGGDGTRYYKVAGVAYDDVTGFGG